MQRRLAAFCPGWVKMSPTTWQAGSSEPIKMKKRKIVGHWNSAASFLSQYIVFKIIDQVKYD